MKKILFVLCLGLVSFGYAQCISGDCINGQGTYTYADGYKYIGEFKEGKMHGQGTFTSADGGSYVGEFKEDKMQGQGTYNSADGNKYIGEYKDGKKDGKGIYTWTDGTKYVGEWKDGLKDGQGTYTFSGGDKYVGNYKNGKYHGQGTFTWANGNKYVGEWKDGNKDGQGNGTNADGTIYHKGLWENGEPVNYDYNEFFQKACNIAFSSEKFIKMNHFNDKNSDAFCVCWTGKVLSNFTNLELDKMYHDATSSNANYYEASYQVFKNPDIQKITIDCMQNGDFEDDSYIDLNPEKLSVFVKQCKDNLKNELSSDDYYTFNLTVDIDDYCECFMTNLLNEFNINEMIKIHESPTNIAKREDIQNSCLKDNLK